MSGMNGTRTTEDAPMIEQKQVESRVPNTSTKELFVTWLSWAVLFFALDSYYIPYWDGILSTLLLMGFLWGVTTEIRSNLSNVPTNTFSFFDWVAYIPFYLGLFVGSLFKKRTSPLPYIKWNPLYHGFALKAFGFFIVFAVGGVSMQYILPPNKVEYGAILGVLFILMSVSMSTKHVWKIQEKANEAT